MRDAVLTGSPKRQKRGLADPSTPATTGPVWILERAKGWVGATGSDSTALETCRALDVTWLSWHCNDEWAISGRTAMLSRSASA